jgi:hypothetical protein
MTRLPRVLSGADLPLPELHAARLDGELYAVGACFSPVDEIEGCAHRALALGATLHPRIVAERRTAAWVWGASGTAQPALELCVGEGTRLHESEAGWGALREVVLLADDVTTIAGLQVTTPLRTAVDLARRADGFGADDALAISRLSRIGGFGLAECEASLTRTRNLPGRRPALRRLGEILDAQPEFTR